jgi:molecular chaperone HtpG
LQSDSNVKKISTYISKKVSDRLQQIFKNDRKEFEEKWNDLKIFINYGMLTEEDFYDKANKFALLQDTDGNKYTYEEYKNLVSAEQTDKEGNIIYLYSNDKEKEYSFIDNARSKGYNVLHMDGQLDVALISLLERKFEKTRFTRVDSDTVENLIVKEEQKGTLLAETEREVLTGVFESQLPRMEKREFHVQTLAMGENAAPVMITQAEYMRRMKDMAAIQPGMSFYGDMPDMFNMLLNEEHPLIKRVLQNAENACADKLKPIDENKAALEKRRKELYDARQSKNENDVPQSEKDELFEIEKQITAAKSEKEGVLGEYAANDATVKQLIDITLLQNNMLSGEELNNFVKRSIELMK